MTKKLLLIAVLVAAFYVPAYSQGGNVGAAQNLFKSTVGHLPTAATCNASGSSCVYIVTDGNSSTDCTVGGGSTRVFCSSNGTVWASLGGGGGGGISGLTTSVIPKATAATTIGDSSLDDGLTTASTLTYSGSGGIATTGATGSWTATEGTSPSGSASKDIAYADSTAHRFKVNNNNGGAGTFALFTDNLSVFASTTSAQFLGVISDETGSGLVVGATSPTLTTPILGVASATSVALTGANAGFFQCTQGTAQGHATANTLTWECPAAVTAYESVAPGVAASGTTINNNTSSVVTQGFSGDANHSATVTIGSGTSITSTSLCSTTFCTVGTYRVNVYVDLTTACGTTGTYIVNLIYTDDVGSKTVPVNIDGTGSVPATGTLTTTSTANFGEHAQIIRSTGAASINYSTTATACGSAGPMIGKLYISVEPVQ